jgi:hypothetical protein
MEISEDAIKLREELDPESLRGLYAESYRYELKALELMPLGHRWRPVIIYNAALMAEGAGLLEESHALMEQVEDKICDL